MDKYNRKHTCQHCGVQIAWDETFSEWFHVEEPTRGEDAIYCAGTERLVLPVGAVDVYANETEDGGYGDIYFTEREVKLWHPGANVLQGWSYWADDVDIHDK